MSAPVPSREGYNAAAETTGRRLAVLSLAALGVVYGNIGTSPLYAIRECFHGEYGSAPTPANVLGVLSLMFWSMRAPSPARVRRLFTREAATVYATFDLALTLRIVDDAGERGVRRGMSLAGVR